MDRDPTDGIDDPFEDRNRRVHAFNKDVDQTLVRPLGIAYASTLPPEIQSSVGHFATNLGQPSVAANSLLQGDLRGFGIASLRFAVNSTVGIAGLFDAATDLGMPQHDTDFGETLYVWGVEEGPYVEAPFIGPSTRRHTVGRFVDFFLDPIDFALGSPERYYGTIASATNGIGARGRLVDTIDGVLYDSADSYAQTRQIYLQNRRFKLGVPDQAAEIDPFALDTEGF